MHMESFHSEKCLCSCCMNEHDIQFVYINEVAEFKNVQVNYKAVYSYCNALDRLYTTREQTLGNEAAVKDAYRASQGLLTSREICEIRSKYGITQNDLCILLGWGAKTITRYEHHQVQDKAHDTILKKIAQDPAWFLDLLERAKDVLPHESFRKYFETGTAIYESHRDSYLRKTIESEYARFLKDEMIHGNTALSLDKVVEVIRYFSAAPGVTNLFKVKLMKMIWHADRISYTKRGAAMTGLVYTASQMGALPVAHDSIVALNGVPCQEVDLGETYACYFYLAEKAECVLLDEEDKEILRQVIEVMGNMTKDEIAAMIQSEQTSTKAVLTDVIQFRHVGNLQI